MEKLQLPYTLGVWTVKQGKESEFVAEWTGFARWTAENHPGAATGYLLQDPQDPANFISFGAWQNTDAIRAWRESAQFRAFTLKVRDLCADFQPRSFLLVATSDSVNPNPIPSSHERI